MLCLVMLLNGSALSADEVFRKRVNGSSTQVLLGIGEFFGGFFAFVAGAAMHDTSSGQSKRHLDNVKSAQNALDGVRDAIRQDQRLQEILELERALYAAKAAGCGAAVEEMGNSLAALIRSAPGEGQRRMEEWNSLEAQWEHEVSKREQARSNHMARAKAVLAVGTLLFVDIGVRIYVFQEEERSPGPFPTANIAWAYGIRPCLRLLGVYDTLEKAFVDEQQTAESLTSP